MFDSPFHHSTLPQLTTALYAASLGDLVLLDQPAHFGYSKQLFDFQPPEPKHHEHLAHQYLF